ncbi:hypothetical protein FRB94_012772 [Tulasnella sp. JGI-2019a]|nr:hypothetical protein FRB94_012772 [Tulasnella sp. JGI-2019a]KAG9018485.1 hypothetical protein FRB93_000188 [Tulasnella sp. JGI-2019a]KAG9037476.1 hypothetical protein FRB95_005415 [Tulasnella sp. JGI-2019a]
MGVVSQVVALLSFVWIVRRIVQFRGLINAYKDVPRRTVLVSPFSTLIFYTPLQWVSIPGVFLPRLKVFREDYDAFAGIGSDIFVVVHMFPLGAQLMLADANAIRDVSAARVSFPKPVSDYKAVSLYGTNMIGAEGHEWARHRKACASSFSDRNLQLVWDSAAQTMQEIFSSWSGEPEIRIPIIRVWTLKIALHILSAAGFGMPTPWEESDSAESKRNTAFQKTLEDALDDLPWKFVLPDRAWGNEAEREAVSVAGWAGNGWLGKRAKQAAVTFSELERYMKEMIQDRRTSGINESQKDLLSNLISASGDGAGGLTMREVTGNTFVFLLAGHETSAHSLAFMFGLLALDPDEQERLYQHIKAVLGDREPTYSDFNSLNRVLATIHETLRLYPPVTGIPKECVTDTLVNTGCEGTDELRTVRILEGTRVAIQIAAVAYNPHYWEDPWAFNPSRFLKDPSRARDGTFLTFSSGARSCIGRRFSEVESVAVATLLLLRYKISVDTTLFKDVEGENALERRKRFLETDSRITVFPINAPLIFTRR